MQGRWRDGVTHCQVFKSYMPYHLVGMAGGLLTDVAGGIPPYSKQWREAATLCIPGVD